ncbi:hypothetical protein ABTD55_22240, partial [Acinetobacter baumannii]
GRIAGACWIACPATPLPICAFRGVSQGSKEIAHEYHAVVVIAGVLPPFDLLEWLLLATISAAVSTRTGRPMMSQTSSQVWGSHEV